MFFGRKWQRASLLAIFLLGIFNFYALFVGFTRGPWHSVYSHLFQQFLRLPNNNVILFENANACISDENVPISFMVFVLSTADAFERRQFIRQTFANKTLYEKYAARFVFLIGVSPSAAEALKSEFDLYSDLVVADFVDTYVNLVLKTLLAMKWYLERCRPEDNVWFVKIDDDVLLDLARFKRFRQYYELFADDAPQISLSNNLNRVPLRILCGTVDHILTANRFPLSKYYISWSEWPEWYFPPYCYGSGYVIPAYDTVSALYNASFSVPLIHLEDVYFTGILVRHLLRQSAELQRDDFNFSSNDGMPRVHIPVNRGDCLQGNCWQRFRPIIFHSNQNQSEMSEVWDSMSQHKGRR